MNKILTTFFCLFVCFGIAQAANAPAAAGNTAPDPSGNPVLSNIQKMGAKLFYLGNRAGMDGWFIMKSGQMQIAYATPDNKSAVIGALFGQDGENITVLQINTLSQNNKEVADLLASAENEQSAITLAGASVTTQPVPAVGTLPAANLSPGERLMHDLNVTAATTIIGNPASPEISMVMDPRCPHCQATWKAMRDQIIKGTVHIRMIPIGAKDSDNERAAAMLLTQTDPLSAWDKYVSGDKTTLAGAPSPAALAAVRANHAIIDNWKIESTPYLVYRAKDGKIKVLQGEPDKVSTIMTDMGL